MLLSAVMVHLYPWETRPCLATTKLYKEYHHSCCYLLLWYRYNLKKQDHVWHRLNTVTSTIIHAVTLLLWYRYNLEKRDHVWHRQNTLTRTIIQCCLPVVVNDAGTRGKQTLSSATSEDHIRVSSSGAVTSCSGAGVTKGRRGKREKD